MGTLDQVINELRHSPRLPQVLDTLQSELEEEKKKRSQFYQDMTPDEKVEFIDGEIILHSPARNRHLDITKQIVMLLNPYIQIHELGTLKIEKCLVVFPRNDYEPDIVFFGNSKAAKLDAETMKFPVPDLIVEVLSESTEHRDRGVKFEDYQANGVGEYWIIDPEQSVIEQYLLKSGEYELAMKSSSGKLVSSVITDFSVDVEAFFDSDKNLEALRNLV